MVEYRIAGALDIIRWPRTLPTAGRCHELWRQTCFELFFGMKGTPAYWEVNWVPCGAWGREGTCWNVYHFAGYRSQMREEEVIGAPVCRVMQDPGFLSFPCTIHCAGLLDDSSDLHIGVSSVIEATDGSLSYWAVDHHGAEPDFHNRSSFSMLLPGVNNAT